MIIAVNNDTLTISKIGILKFNRCKKVIWKNQEQRSELNRTKEVRK